jgi:hypothetical protein
VPLHLRPTPSHPLPFAAAAGGIFMRLTAATGPARLQA